MNTINFYNQKSAQLIQRYDNANMSTLHNLLLKYIPNASTILDIGFGSGRDLEFLSNNDYNIWGIDPSFKFVENAKKRFPNIKNQFIQSSVPFEKKSIKLNMSFNAVISIAMWMHLQHNQYQSVVENIVSLTKAHSTIIISFSKGNRNNDKRYFEDVNLEYITKLFFNKGFFLVDTIKNNDSLDRETLTWITVIYQND